MNAKYEWADAGTVRPNLSAGPRACAALHMVYMSTATVKEDVTMLVVGVLGRQLIMYIVSWVTQLPSHVSGI